MVNRELATSAYFSVFLRQSIVTRGRIKLNRNLILKVYEY